MANNNLQLLLIDNGIEAFDVLKKNLKKTDNNQGQFHQTDLNDNTLNHLKNHAVDVIFLNFKEEEHDSYAEELELLRDIRLWNTIPPIITITNNDNFQLAGKSNRAGSDDFLNLKTITPEKLTNTLNYSIELREKRRSLRRDATIDGLTRLHNRKSVLKIMHDSIKNTIRHNRQLFVCLVDLDGFKKINDTHGHIMGDNVLEQVGQIISSSLRAGDSAGRYGGDEFLILLEDTNSHGAKKTMQRILKNIHTNKFIENDNSKFDIDLTVSVGITEFDGEDFRTIEDVGDLMDIIDHTDKALYLAKEKKGNRIERRKYKRFFDQKSRIQISYGNQKQNAELLNYSKQGLQIRFNPVGSYKNEITILFESTNQNQIERTAHVQWSNEEKETNKVTVGLDVEVPAETRNYQFGQPELESP